MIERSVREEGPRSFGGGQDGSGSVFQREGEALEAGIAMVAVGLAEADTVETILPAEDVARLIGGLRRAAPRSSPTAPALAAGELLERAQAGETEPCVREGAVAWEVLWAVQRLPADEMSPALEELHRKLLRLTSAPLRRERPVDGDVRAHAAVVTRLR